MWRLAGYNIERPLADAISEHACTWVHACFPLQRESRQKRLHCYRGDMSCSRGKGTEWASRGAALLGDEGKSRGQDQNAKESKRECLRPACKITLGRTEAALQLINNAQHLQGSSKAWTQEWTNRSFGQRRSVALQGWNVEEEVKRLI